MTSTRLPNGIELEYEEHGPAAGEPVLLVMGLGAQMIVWPLEFVERLVDHGYRVIRYDNRDAGLSSEVDAPPPGIVQLATAMVARRWARAPYTVPDLADDAAGLLTALDIDRAHVVGASMGGMIAQALTIGHPDRVSSLTSIMSNTGDRRNGGLTLRALLHMARLMAKPAADPVEAAVAGGQIISGPHFDTDDARRLAKEAHDRSYRPDGAARQTLGILASPDRTPGLRNVRVPTLVIHGLRDPLVKPSGGIATANAVPGAKLVMYPDMGHDLPRQRWDDVIPEIVANIARAPLARPAVAAVD